MLTRRACMGAVPLVAALSSSLAVAQQRLPRVAIVENGEPVANIVEGGHPWWDAFLRELRRMGHVDGRSIAIERHTLTGQTDADFAAIAAAVVATAPDIIVTRALQLIAAFKAATTTIPVVGMGSFPPEFASLGRHGGNVTGVNATPVELYTKQMQLLTEIVPGADRFGWLGPRSLWETSPVTGMVRAAATGLGGTLVPALIESPINEATIRAAFETPVLGSVGGLFVNASATLTFHDRLIADLALARRLPAIATQTLFAEAGILMSYGPDFVSAWARGAHFVDRILAGVPPSELPIEQPTSFDMVVNLETADALGIALPPSVMLLATRFIE